MPATKLFISEDLKAGSVSMAASQVVGTAVSKMAIEDLQVTDRKCMASLLFPSCSLMNVRQGAY